MLGVLTQKSLKLLSDAYSSSLARGMSRPIFRFSLRQDKGRLFSKGLTEQEFNLLDWYGGAPAELDKWAGAINKVPLFDKQLNQRYIALQNVALSHSKQGKLAEWFIGFIRTYCDPRFNLKPEEIPSLNVVKESDALQDLKKRYKHPYTRPIFTLNFKDYQTFYKILTDGGTGSAGCCISGGHLDRDPRTEGLRIIIASNSDELAYHELRHSIDPYCSLRKGNDKVLEEFIAFFGNIIRGKVIYSTINTYDAQRNITSTSQTSQKITSTLSYVLSGLKSELYHQQMCSHLSFNDYKSLIDSVFQVLNALTIYYSLDEIDFLLFNCRTLEQLQFLYLTTVFYGNVFKK